MAILRIVSSIVVLSALTVFPDIIDDFEDGDNRNETGYYSYYYDDSPDGGTSIITSALKDSKGKMVMLPTANAGRDGGYAAEISWKFGENKPVGCSGKCDYGQLVGMGTMLAAEGATATWAKNATTIRFCVKAVTTCKLTVEIGTLAVTDFGYHFKTVPVTTEWTLVSITLADLPQPLWAIESMLDPADMTKIQFKISADNSGTPSSGTLYIDDIEIDEVIPPFQNGICDYCIVEREYFIWNYHGSCKELLADFEGEANLTQSKLRGRYWYVYNDSTRPDVIPSRFTYGTQKNEDDGSDMLIVNPGNFDGYNNTQGLKVSFKLGESFMQGTDLIRSFAGVGCMLSYSDTSGIEPVKKYINGSFCSGIYFDYKTDSVHERFKFFNI